MKKLMEMLKTPFQEPAPLEMISQQLAEAHRELLRAEQGRDYADSIVLYNQTLITRLNERMEQYK